MTGTDVRFDPLAEGYAEHPYEQYAALRDHDPVHRSELLQGWVVTRFDDVGRLLRDPSVSSDIHHATPNAAHPHGARAALGAAPRRRGRSC